MSGPGGVWSWGVAWSRGVSVPGGCLSQGECLVPWGASSQRVSSPEGCLVPGGVSEGCLVPGGCLVLGGAWSCGVSGSGGGIPACTEADALWTDRQV